MKIIVIGASGLVGKWILLKLLDSPLVEEIVVFSRREVDIVHEKIKNHIIDFEKISEWESLIQGDVLFSALGTTLKTAGSKEAQFRVDFDYQYNIANFAKKNGVKKLVLISSVNADSDSSFFYLSMKGKLEQEVSLLGFESLVILRPGPLAGHRNVPRLGEIISHFCLKFIPNFLLTFGMRPIPGEKVASIAVNSLKSADLGIRIIGPKELHLHHHN